jgi:two-component system phosphate regulon sensor histidine kinase PhoR
VFFSIRSKITLTYTVLFVITILLLGAYLTWFFSNQYLANLESNLLNDARLLAGFVGEQGDLGAFAQRVSQDLNLRVTIIDIQGNPLAETARPVAELENHANRPEVAGALKGRPTTSRRYSNTIDNEMVYGAVPIYSQAGEIAGVFRLAQSLAEVQQAVRNIRMAIFGGALAGIILVWLIGSLVARAITRSLDTLTAKMQDFARGKFTDRTDVRANDEVRELERVFNDMGASLKDSLTILDRERTRVELILQSLPVGVLVIDAQSNLVAANSMARDILGLDQGGENLPLTHLTRNYQLLTFVRELAQGKAPERVETDTFSEDSRRKTLRLMGTTIQQGASTEIVVVLQDITDLKLLEQQRKDLVANISHEIRTPLTAIQGFAETLLDQETDLDTTRSFLGIIRDEAVRLSRLLSDILNLSRLEGGRSRKTGFCNLLEVAEDVVSILSEQARAKEQKLAININQKINVAVEGDYVRQVMMNYVDNAVKYSPQGTEIKIGAEIQDNGMARIAVIDNGPGISPQDQQRVFERFFRVDRSRQRQAGGTGLGLSIVKHLVEGFGGEVGVISHPGFGTSFWATLPLQRRLPL